MRKVLLICFAILSSAMSALACDIKTDTSRTKVADYVREGLVCLDTPLKGYRFDEAIETAFIQKINAERYDRGLPALSVRMELQPAARFQSLDMAVNDFFDHQSPDGRRAAQRVSAFDRTLLAQSTGENIAVFGPTRCFDMDDNELPCFDLPGFELPTSAFVADDLHQKLMDSAGHRANILSEVFTHLAVGVARTESGFYVTQVFANRVGTLSEPLATELEPNASMALAPKIDEWEIGGYLVVGIDGQETELETDQLRGVSPGEKDLIVVGENVSEETRGAKTIVKTEWLNLIGPSFTLIDAKGS